MGWGRWGGRENQCECQREVNFGGERENRGECQRERLILVERGRESGRVSERERLILGKVIRQKRIRDCDRAASGRQVYIN